MPPLRSWVATVAVLFGGGAVLFAATDGFRAVTDEGARRVYVAAQRPPVPSLTFEDMNDLAVSVPDPKHDVTLVGFIYATCPTLCQAAGGDFARMRDRLQAAGLDRHVRLISVSFDPARDSAAVLQAYARAHGADGAAWTVARVDAGDLPQLIDGYGLRIIADRWGGFEHNAAIHAVDRAGRLFAVLDIDDIDGAVELVAGRL